MAILIMKGRVLATLHVQELDSEQVRARQMLLSHWGGAAAQAGRGEGARLAPEVILRPFYQCRVPPLLAASGPWHCWSLLLLLLRLLLQSCLHARNFPHDMCCEHIWRDGGAVGVVHAFPVPLQCSQALSFQSAPGKIKRSSLLHKEGSKTATCPCHS
jgi:hypothetical protein